MKILWVCRKVTNTRGGDAVLDAKLVAGLRRTHTVDIFDIGKNGLRGRLQRIVKERVPPDRAGFGGAVDTAALSSQLARGGYDALIISHEHLDYLVRELAPIARDTRTPIYLIHHNVTSSLMRGVLVPPLGVAVELGYQAYERHALGTSDVRRLFMLSRDDGQRIEAITGRHDIGVLLPGAPPATALAAQARVAPELVMLGSYDWFPKRWSLKHFVAEWQDTPRPGRIFADDGLPESARRALGAEPTSSVDLGEAIRFGLLTDRFKAGHKLKTAAYLMNNCIVVSFADVLDDFRFSPHAELFIRQVHHVRDIAPLMRELSSIPAHALRPRLLEFKAQVAERLAWDKQVDVLDQALREGRAA